MTTTHHPQPHCQFANAHTEALSLLTDGLCRIRLIARTQPEKAALLADAMHNVPNILAGEDKSGHEYLIALLDQIRTLLRE